MRLANIIRIYLILAVLVGCSSTGNKKKSSSPSSSAATSGAQPTSYDNLNAESPSKEQESEKSADQKGSKDSAFDNSGSSKKELYDGIRISLGSTDDSVVEKSVANLLSQDLSDARALNSLGLYHLSRGRDHLAKMIFKSMIDKDPKNPVAFNNLGVIYSQMGETKLAIDNFKKSMALNPNYAIVNANLGTIYAVGRDYSKAKPLLEVAYQGGVKDLAVLNNYAAVLMEYGDSDADKIFKEALQIGASDPNVVFNYALYLTYSKKNFKEASVLIDKIRFIGVPPNKKAALKRMEETISGRSIEQNKGQ